MDDSRISDGNPAQLGTLMAAVESDIERLAREGTTEAHGAAADTLRASWAALVALLDVGPAPELRTCPACGATGMRAALRCGYCWRALSPPPARSGATQ